MQKVDSLEMLEQAYRAPVGERSLWKEIDHINELYARFIEASPFLILASYDDNGVDCSPRGDAPGFVRVASPRCIQIPDRRGNNRLDSLRNVLDNPDVGVIFLVPNAGETLRVSGKAEILTDSELCESFAINGKPASSVLSIQVEKVYYSARRRWRARDCGTRHRPSARRDYRQQGRWQNTSARNTVSSWMPRVMMPTMPTT